ARRHPGGAPASLFQDTRCNSRHPLRGEQFLQALIPLAHAALHAGLCHAVPRLDGWIDGMPDQAAAPFAEVLEGQELDAHDIRVAAELEGLDGELVLADRVEDPAEGVRRP